MLFRRLPGIQFLMLLLACAPSWAAVLTNPDFESGDLSGWTGDGPMSVSIDTNNTFNRNCAGRMSGSFSSSGWVTSSILQSVDFTGGDNVQVLGFVQWRSNRTESAGATGYVQAVLSGTFGVTSRVWSATNSWEFFDLRARLFGIGDVGFESGGLDGWIVGCDNLQASVQSAVVDEGNYALKYVGSFHNWSWNEVKQELWLNAGDVMIGRARINVASLYSTGIWAVAGIKLEEWTTNAAKYGVESKIEADAEDTGWVTLCFTSAPLPRATTYVYRTMVCGHDVTNCEVYFDDVRLWKQGEEAVTTSAVTLAVSYVGYSGGEGYTNSEDVFVDSLMLKGSTAALADPTNILTALRGVAMAIGTNAAVPIPAVEYPGLRHFGYPSYETNVQNFAVVAEVGMSGWKFKPMKRFNTLVTATNTITLSALSTNGAGFIEFDQYRYVGIDAGKERGDPVVSNTNTPYFALGARDNSSAEFGDGPFGSEHTYVIGTPLTNFPRRMSTDGSGGWPSRLNVVFQENFSTNAYDPSLWQKYFCLYGVTTNGEASNVKACKVGLYATRYGVSNDVDIISQEIHLGWATEAESRGMVDYPNLTYQDHNEVALRAGWLHNLLDKDGWYVSQSPRGSATIEPIDLYFQQAGNWTWRPYEEYLYTWANAASGVRSIFDSDSSDALPGPASYHVGFKIGHENGTNDLGETLYPEVLNIRGCGYYRMTDYDGVMAGSFRPMAADVFGLYAGNEDAPLIPEAYIRLVPRTTTTSEPDNSYAEAYQLIRSKTNGWYIGAAKTQMHFAPAEVASNGCYFDLEMDTWANKAVAATNHGLLACFSQVSMHWRGGTNINDGREGHDIDTVMLKKSDGEWVTHTVLNPFTNIYQRTLSTFASNDVVYLQQQDRGKDSYGFATEAPYRRASAFEITMLDDGGLPLSLDVYENSTVSEIADNVNITCQIHKDIAEGERLHYKYRYRTVYAPGVTITAPNDADGGENWSSNRYRIEFFATDGHDEEVSADVYYGSGLDGGWTQINTNGPISVSTNTHKASCDWDVSAVPAGAYYIKVAATRVAGGKTGFDVSDARLQVAPTYGFAFNASTNLTVVTNAIGHVGTNMSFETGTLDGWSVLVEDVAAEASYLKAQEGEYSAQLHAAGWSNWSWNSVVQLIPCVSGEELRVTGKVYIQSLAKAGTNWVRCGVKMESTNEAGRTSTGVEFDQSSPIGEWLDVDFVRSGPVDGADGLVLWVGGTDAGKVDVFFDNLVVTSTNTGVVVTNGVRTGYWQGASPANVSGHNVLSFWVNATYGAAGPEVCVSDDAGATNRVALTNFVARVVSLPQRVDIAWTNFASIDRARVTDVRFAAGASNDLQASRMKSWSATLIARSRIAGAPQADREGLPHFNPGDTVTNVLTIENVSAAAVTGVNVQVVQEYAETLLWLDASPGVAEMWSPYTRTGDRLCGTFEQAWTGRTVAAGSSIVLTNVYIVPTGRRVDHLRSEFETRDWYFLRNYACRGRADVSIRTAAGDNVFQGQGIGAYSMDDDYDIDNDGLPDAWEIQHSGTYTGLRARLDADADGLDNLSEYIAATDPTNRLSVTAVDDVEYGAGGRATVWFGTVTGRVYWVEWSPSLTNAVWTPVNTNLIIGDGGAQSLIDTDSPYLTNRYYKVGTKFSDRAWPL